MKENLVLKGGTAINLTVFNLPRLSVDIDLDYAQPVGREVMMGARTALNADLIKHIETQGYVIGSRSKSTHSLDSWVLEYRNSGGNVDKIKIEVNYSMRAHVLPVEERPIVTDILQSRFAVRTLSPIELYASKTAALLDRTAARDLYDVYNMVHFGLFDESQLPMLRKSTVFYAALSASQVPLALSTDVIDQLTEHRIKTDLLPVLRRKDGFTLKSAKAEVKAFLTDLLSVSEAEAEFLSLFRRGIYNPGLLFDDLAVVERVKAHPMALWRMAHL